MYAVRLAMMILSVDGTAEVSCRLTLPFAPFPGLLLDLEDEGDCAHVAAVRWSVPGDYFQVQCQPCDDRDVPPDEQLVVREWVAYYQARGWHLGLTPEATRRAGDSAREAARAEGEAGQG